MGKVIVEGFIPFDYEITLLTVRHAGGTSFCEPIGHLQIDGDYRESWQPHPMPDAVLKKAQDIAAAVTDNLAGYGIFGVELFIDGEEVYFSEVSPRPHDTGLVTLISQDLSQFALHARAILGLPVPSILSFGPSASCALLGFGESDAISFSGVEHALKEPGTALRLFGKPEVRGQRRLGVTLALGGTIEEARSKARSACDAIEVQLG
jgi:phosphoribosylglycinamide formyltransferase 2